ncbi:uncharacterized protein A4U43_C06F11580 [Asparagus officinalis]|uniref:BZIP domain-containing protein n=1 Tax=Asparagus officinalis TaxID=4686 RepID=A0A5P1EL78_ASPOF|nr:basic leucine zipper 6-like [Asparagus officinalis]ONK66752.1 uncharacterized protein A4U43_C06F11580 [Asparagus officinalis]
MAQLPPKAPNWPNFGQSPPSADEPDRGSHRRSVSDSFAFFETPVGPNDSEEFDDDQFMCMFSDDAPMSPSDRRNVNEERMEVEHQSQNESEASFLDPKRVKRILANRQSAQRSRVRKLQYVSELERSVTTLQNEVSALSPRVAFLDHQRSVLTVGNSHLKQRIAALAQDKIFKDAHQEALQKEIERLRQVYYQQNLKKMTSPSSEANARRVDKQIVI